MGPAAPDRRWQARTADGVTAAPCVRAWEAQPATCPHGHTRVPGLPRQDRHGQVAVDSRFAQARGAACPVRARRAGGRCRTGTRPQHSKLRGTDSRRRCSRCSTPAERGSQGQFPTARAWGTYAGRAPSGWSKPASCSCSWRRRSPVCGWRPGWRRRHDHERGGRPLPRLQEHPVNGGR